MGSSLPSTHPPPSERLGGRLLVCDDSASIRQLIRDLLGNQFECVEAASGEEALLLLEHFIPDLILCDRVMGEIDGYDLCARVRSRPETASVPFILITGRKQEDGRAQALERGADDYLAKPLSQRELMARVTSLLRLRRASQALKARTAELEESNRRLRDTQFALAQSERLATVGTLASGVAHEVNNPLAYMKAGVAVIRSRVTDIESRLRRVEADRSGELGVELAESFSELHEVGAEIEEGVRRIERIVADLRDFASERKEEYEEVELADEVHRAWKVALMRGGSKPKLQAHLAPNTTLFTVRHRFGQVLLNLFVNAIQAMDGTEGKVVVSAQADAEDLYLSIADTGPGIPEQIAERIFDPFFTTKAPNVGTGLGLSVSFGIMRSLGGSISVESPPGQGATFTLRLPCPREEQRRMLTAATHPAPSA